MEDYKFSVDLDFGYSTCLNNALVFPFDKEILKLELVNNTDPNTSFRVFIGTTPSYESQPVTSITIERIKEGLVRQSAGSDSTVLKDHIDNIVLPDCWMAPFLTLDSKGLDDMCHDVHMRVTFLIKREHYAPPEATILIKDLVERTQSPFVRGAVQYFNDGESVFFKGSVKPPATQGQCY